MFQQELVIFQIIFCAQKKIKECVLKTKFEMETELNETKERLAVPYSFHFYKLGRLSKRNSFVCVSVCVCVCGWGGCVRGNVQKYRIGFSSTYFILLDSTKLFVLSFTMRTRMMLTRNATLICGKNMDLLYEHFNRQRTLSSYPLFVLVIWRSCFFFLTNENKSR